jgi:hypothetical protein
VPDKGSDNVAALKSELDKDTGPKILNQKKDPVEVHIVHEHAQIRGLEKRRLENEAHLLWDVYFTRSSKREERAEARREKTVADADKKSQKERLQDRVAANKRDAIFADKKGNKKDGIKGVTGEVTDKVKKSGLDINKNKVAAEASIFWQVYYTIKKRKEPKKDTKGITKITPAKKAISEVKGKELPKKKGWFASLIDMIKPFVSSFLLAAAPVILKFVAIAAAIGGAIVAFLNLGPKIKDLWNRFWDLEKGTKETDEAFAALAKKTRERAGEAAEDPRREAEAARLGLTEQITALEYAAKKKADEEIGGVVYQTAGNFFSVLGTGAKDLLSRVGIGEHSGKSVADVQRDQDRERAKIRARIMKEANIEINKLKDKRDAIERAYGPEALGHGVAMGEEITDKRAAAHAKMIAAKEAAERRAFFASEQVHYITGEQRSKKELEEMWANKLKQDKEIQEKAIADANKITAEYRKKKDKKEEEEKKKKESRGSGAGSSAYGAYMGGHGMYRDFVSRPGMPPVSFSSKDDILGFKQGGPVSNLLKHQADTVTGSDKFGKFQLSEIKRSNAYLKQLVELTAKILQKGPSGGGGNPGFVPPAPLPPNNGIQGDMSGPTYADSRSDFYSSAYSIHTPSVPA